MNALKTNTDEKGIKMSTIHEITMQKAEELVATDQFHNVKEAWEEAVAICEQGAYEGADDNGRLADDPDDPDDDL
jgi:hypothetical protein